MLLQLRRSVIAVVFFLVLCGLIYPLAEVAMSQTLFPFQANGSITKNGSLLIGQRWTSPRWFVGRPDPYNPMASGATNLGPNSKALAKFVSGEVKHWHELGVNPTTDLVTGSGSGLDPDISPAGAFAQAGIVSRARHLPYSEVASLVKTHIAGQQLGFLGAQYVNVLQLNEALSKLR